MFEQRIAKHAQNSVLEISKLIPFSLSSKKKKKMATRLREKSNGYSVMFCSFFRILKISATVKPIFTDFFQSCKTYIFQTKIPTDDSAVYCPA